MARRVVTSAAAATGLRDARLWLMQPGSGPAGRARWIRLRDARKQLGTLPYSGPASADHPGCRALVVEGYFIVYELDPDTGDSETAGDVTVLAVFPPGAGDRRLR